MKILTIDGINYILRVDHYIWGKQACFECELQPKCTSEWYEKNVMPSGLDCSHNSYFIQKDGELYESQT